MNKKNIFNTLCVPSIADKVILDFMKNTVEFLADLSKQNPKLSAQQIVSEISKHLATSYVQHRNQEAVKFLVEELELIICKMKAEE
ncbi:MAG: hypothetical protein WC483_06935 [Candidatus Paceibacterota bacterium]